MRFRDETTLREQRGTAEGREYRERRERKEREREKS